MTYPYLHVAFSPDLTGKDRKIYRFLEIFPGAFIMGNAVVFGFGFLAKAGLGQSFHYCF